MSPWHKRTWSTPLGVGIDRAVEHVRQIAEKTYPGLVWEMEANQMGLGEQWRITGSVRRRTPPQGRGT